jgi:hypothetical protein
MTIYSDQEQISIGDTPRINTPMLWINKYLQEKIAENIKVAVPFFPTTPSNIEDLVQPWITIAGERYPYAGVMCTYDRMLKLRRKAFPHIKCEQLLNYFYATESDVAEIMIAITETLLRLFDGEDESAQDLNSWAVGKTINLNGVEMSNQFFFHNFRVYQLEESRDISSFGSVRTFGASKLIIDYDYHRVS